MRITDDIRRCVVFFGYEDVTSGKGGINCIGTGFLLEHDGLGYLVTAQHLAHDLGEDPFLLRVNKHDGTSANLHVDGAVWISHPDPTVDLAAIPLFLNLREGYNIIYLGGETLELTKEQLVSENIGIGDLTYTVGLFRLMSGERRNLPVCHFGTISLFPDDEKIPTLDWRDPTGKKTILTEGFLIETQSLSGLSGSPVFVRSETMFDPSAFPLKAPPPRPLESRKVLWPRVQLRLLGLWAGSWTLPPDDVKAMQSRSPKGAQVPLGMGVVVPCYKIVEMLDLPEIKQNRDDLIREYQPNAINLDAVRMAELHASHEQAEKDAEPLEIKSAILCEAIRPEISGQNSLLGVYGEQVWFSTLPDRMFTTLFMKIRGEPGFRRLTLRIVDEDGNPLRENFKCMVRIDENSTKAEMSARSLEYRLEKPCVVSFQLQQSADGAWQELVSYEAKLLQPS